MLTQHPDITRRLREEISNTVGHCRPTLEQMKEMKYLRAFINGALDFFFHPLAVDNEIETLRLYPPV
jgi:cytochrome P450